MNDCSQVPQDVKDLKSVVADPDNFQNSESLKAQGCVVSRELRGDSPRKGTRFAQGSEAVLLKTEVGNEEYVVKSNIGTPKVDNEFEVGLQLNKLRTYLPNFVGTISTFSCARPSGDIICPPSYEAPSRQFVYENIEGRDLFSALDYRWTGEQMAQVIFPVMFAVLRAAYAFGFTHYDLQSHNIMLRNLPFFNTRFQVRYGTYYVMNPRQVPTIIDFGLARTDLYGNYSFPPWNILNRCNPLVDYCRLISEFVSVPSQKEFDPSGERASRYLWNLRPFLNSVLEIHGFETPRARNHIEYTNEVAPYLTEYPLGIYPGVSTAYDLENVLGKLSVHFPSVVSSSRMPYVAEWGCKECRQMSEMFIGELDPIEKIEEEGYISYRTFRQMLKLPKGDKTLRKLVSMYYDSI